MRTCVLGAVGGGSSGRGGCSGGDRTRGHSSGNDTSGSRWGESGRAGSVGAGSGSCAAGGRRTGRWQCRWQRRWHTPSRCSCCCCDVSLWPHTFRHQLGRIEICYPIRARAWRPRAWRARAWRACAWRARAWRVHAGCAACGGTAGRSICEAHSGSIGWHAHAVHALITCCPTSRARSWYHGRSCRCSACFSRC